MKKSTRKATAKKAAKKKTIRKLLFVDTNIWLDFYRGRNDASLSLLKHVEAIQDSVIVTYQLEGEYKKNRQAAIRDGMRDLKPPDNIPRLAIFADAKSTKILNRNIKDAETRVKGLKKRFVSALRTPGANDSVYQICQRIFHKEDPLTLRRDDPAKIGIRRRAFRRFLHGCPPRKRDDTSFGDGFNWEWMIHCAKSQNAELVIVSRDTDFGLEVDGEVFINDHLRQEFSERVSQKREILLYTRLSEALKHFEIPVTENETSAENEIVESKTKHLQQRKLLAQQSSIEDLQSIVENVLARMRGQIDDESDVSSTE